MYAKIYDQIFDSSIAEDHEVRHGFMDLMVLADSEGVVDMTPEAIARRTNVPLEFVRRYLTELSQPDPRSRSPEEEGRRIKLIDSHRDWGWQIVNYDHYRLLRDEAARREYFRDAKRRERQREKESNPSKMSNDVKRCQTGPTLSTHAEAEAYTEARTESPPLAVEPPSNFPKTAKEALAGVGAMAVPDDFVVTTWNKAMSRAGVDSKGQAIRSWPHYVALEWKYEQERAAKTRSGANGKGDSFWKDTKELEMVQKEIDAIKNRASETAMGKTYSQADGEKLKKLVGRKKELKGKLGL